MLLIDRRPHIGGNAYDHYDDAGMLIHRYGPHIFHTNSREIFDYLSRFTAWRPYEHRVLAQRRRPAGADPDQPRHDQPALRPEPRPPTRSRTVLAARAEPVAEIRTSEDVVVSRVGRELYEKFFRGYTRKQWGLDPSELDKSVTARVPDPHQPRRPLLHRQLPGMPLHGYTRMFENMLDHPNIKVMLNTDYREIAGR